MSEVWSSHHTIGSASVWWKSPEEKREVQGLSKTQSNKFNSTEGWK